MEKSSFLLSPWKKDTKTQDVFGKNQDLMVNYYRLIHDKCGHEVENHQPENLLV